MIFWTIVFLMINVCLLGKGKLGHKLLRESGEMEIKTNNNEEVDPQKAVVLGLKVLGLIAFSITYLIGYVLYLSVAIGNPITYLISVIMLALLITDMLWNLIKIKKVNINLKTEEGRVNYFKRYDGKQTVKGFLFQLVYILYFGVMLLLLAAY